MPQPADNIQISVVVCTYNRVALLERVLDLLAAQAFPPDRYEVVVVDNNSDDGTRAMVERLAGRAKVAVRYLFEPRQGKSFALNHGIRAARGRWLAFTDDDVRVEPDWLERVYVRLETDRPDLMGGRVVPDWAGSWPDWFRPDYYGVVGVYDLGDAPIFLTLGRHRLPGGANMAGRADTFRRFGPFREDLSDGRLHRSEDFELFQRVLLQGGRVLYAPDVVVHHHVAPERLTRGYVRAWWVTQGRANARMRLDETETVPRILGVPRWMFRQAVTDGLSCGLQRLRGDANAAFFRETQLARFYGYVAERWRRA